MIASSDEMPADDHHSAYLAGAVAALTPAGRARVDELLEQLAEAVGGREPLLRFAIARKAEADAGSTGGETAPAQGLTPQDLNALLAGFMRIRDDEPLDDVADWANAVIALLEDSIPGSGTA
jgi:hypothetical protein